VVRRFVPAPKTPITDLPDKPRENIQEKTAHACYAQIARRANLPQFRFSEIMLTETPNQNDDRCIPCQ
jgi:hypothetical protein